MRIRTRRSSTAPGRYACWSIARPAASRRSSRPLGLPALDALTAADLDADGAIDLVAVDAEGNLRRLTRRGDRWDVAVVGAWPGAGGARLFAADLDNNGALDVLVSRPGVSRAWLADETYALNALTGPDRRGDLGRGRPQQRRAPGSPGRRCRRGGPLAREGQPRVPLEDLHAPARSRTRATSGSIPSASAARSRSRPACCGRSRCCAAAPCTSGSARAPASTSHASCGPTACHRRSSASASTTRSWRSSGSRGHARGCSPTTAAASPSSPTSCGARRWAFASTPRTPPASPRPKTGCASAAISSRRATAATICGSPPSCGRRTSSTMCR